MTHIKRRHPARFPLLATAIALAIVPLHATTAGRAPAPSPSRATAPARAPVQADAIQFIVRFKDASAEHGNAAQRQRKLDDIGRTQGLRLVHKRRMAVGADVIRANRALGPDETKALLVALSADPRVDYAEVDVRVHAMYWPNDEDLSYYQWHFHEATGGINLPAAWDISTGSGQVVAVIDTGILPHVDLDANRVAGYDFIADPAIANDGDGRDADPSDPGDWTVDFQCNGLWPGRSSSWHGTHVAGLVAAVANNYVGGVGGAYHARFQPVRVLGTCGGNMSDVDDAIVWASGGTVAGVPANATPAAVINVSFGGYSSCGASTQAAIDQAFANGSVVVAPAGNTNHDASDTTPANCGNVLAVAATDRTGRRAGYSNYGSVVDLSAPGGYDYPVHSTSNAGTTGPAQDSYAGREGTSQAAAHVSATAALVRAASGNTLRPAEVMALLQATARPLPIACPQGCGAGIVDAGTAVAVAKVPTLLISDPVAIAEGADGITSELVFTVSLSEAAKSNITFDIATVDGSATGDSDFVAMKHNGRVLAKGATTLTFMVPILGDNLFEADETFQVLVDNVTGPVMVIDDTATGQITNDDAMILENTVPVVAIADGVARHSLPFTLQVPDDASNLSFTLSGPNNHGDADLYVRRGVPPTRTTFDCRSFLAFSNESCVITNAQPGTWHGFIYAFSAYDSVTLTGSYSVPVDIGVGDETIVEGQDGTKTVTFTVVLSRRTNLPVRFDFATADGTATVADGDYVALDAPASVIGGGELSRQFSVVVNGDDKPEADEAFSVALANIDGATAPDGDATGTVTNDDLPTLSIDDVTAVELDSGARNFTFTVTLSQPWATPVSFDLATADGTATTAGLDYDFVNGSATLQPGATTQQFGVTVRGDPVVEGDESFVVNLTNATGATISDDQGTGTITNDDLPALSIDDVAVVEGDGETLLTFTASLSTTSPFPVTFDIASADATATAGVDYDAYSATGMQIPAGQAGKTFSIAVHGDTAIEASETFVMNLSNVANATLPDGQGVGTITNDDFPTLSIDDATAVELDSGARNLTFTVTLSQPSTTPVTFDLATADGTATTAGGDYDFVQGTATLPPGATSQQFGVTVRGDNVIEPDETFVVNLANATGATISDDQGTGTIVNDDLSQLSIANATVTEGNAGTRTLNFTVSLAPASNVPVGFDFTAGAGTATPGADFDAIDLAGQVIPAGQTSKVIAVTIHGDTSDEGNETVLASIGNASGAGIADGGAIGTIVDDDAPTLALAAGPTVAEGDTGTKSMSYTVRLSKAAAYAVTYDIATSNAQSTATAGSDYVASSLVGVTIAAGQTSKVFAVTILGDTTLEANESVRVVLANGSVAITGGAVFGTIANDDGPKLSIADAGFQEGNSGSRTLNLTVSLSQVSATPVTFNIATVDGTAMAGPDYVARSLVGETIPAGTLSRTFSVTTHGDMQVEGNETLFARIGTASVPVLDGQARGLLINDDGAVLSIGDATIVEGDSGNKVLLFTVSLSQLASAKVTFDFSTAAVTASGGSDFDPVSLTGVTIPYGQLSRNVAVIIRGDTVVEPNETLQGNIAMGNVSILDGVGAGTITNDD